MHHEIKTKKVEANGLTFQVDTCGTGDKFAIVPARLPGEAPSPGVTSCHSLAELGLYGLGA